MAGRKRPARGLPETVPASRASDLPGWQLTRCASAHDRRSVARGRRAAVGRAADSWVGRGLAGSAARSRHAIGSAARRSPRRGGYRGLNHGLFLQAGERGARAASRTPPDRHRRRQLSHRPVRARGHRASAGSGTRVAALRPGPGPMSRGRRRRDWRRHGARHVLARLLPLRVSRGHGGDKPYGPRRRGSDAVGSQPQRRLGAGLARRRRSRSRRRLHIQVPKRRARRARLHVR